VSAKYPNPTATDLDKHIILAVHGYYSYRSGREFADWSAPSSSYRISQVLLDGHGRDYESFKASTWQDWSSAIKENMKIRGARIHKN
jgi:carboxylesterase